MASHFQFVILLLDLLLLGLFLVLVIDVVNISMTDEIVTIPFFVARSNLSLLVVVVNEHLLLMNVELSLLDLIGCGKIWVQFKLLCHLVDQDMSTIVVLLNLERLRCQQIWVGREGNTTVDQLIRAIFIFLDNFVLLIEEFFS